MLKIIKYKIIQIFLLIMIFLVSIFLVSQITNYQNQTDEQLDNNDAGLNTITSNKSLYLVNLHHINDYSILAAFDENGIIHELSALNFYAETILNHTNYINTPIQELLFNIEDNYLPTSEDKIKKIELVFSIYQNGNDDTFKKITDFFETGIQELNNYSYDLIILDKEDFFNRINLTEETMLSNEDDMESYLKQNLDKILNNNVQNKDTSLNTPTKPDKPDIVLPTTEEKIEIDTIPEIPKELEIESVPSLQ